MTTYAEGYTLTDEQKKRIEELSDLVDDDVKGIDDLLLQLRELLADRLIKPRLQELADMLGTGIWGANGTVSTCDSFSSYDDVIHALCSGVSDHWWGKVIPAGTEGHVFVQDPDRPRQDYCRVCGRAQGKHE